MACQRVGLCTYPECVCDYRPPSPKATPEPETEAQKEGTDE